MANSTVNELDEKFSMAWLAENVTFDKRLMNYDTYYILTGELRMRQAVRFIKFPEEAQNEEMFAASRDRIYNSFYNAFHTVPPAMKGQGRALDSLRPEEIGELTNLAEAFSRRLKEMNIVDHVQIYGIEANRRGGCFISESREPIEEYEDD